MASFNNNDDDNDWSWRRRLYNAYPDVGGAKIISIIGLVAVIVLAVAVAVGYVVLFPTRPVQWYIVFNVVALLLMLSWILTLMHGVFKPSLRALSASIIIQLALIGCCLAVAIMLFVGLYYDEDDADNTLSPDARRRMTASQPTLPLDPINNEQHIITFDEDGRPIDVGDRLDERRRWPLAYNRTALTIALMVYALVQAAFLATTMRARAEIRGAQVPTMINNNSVEMR